MTKQQLREEFVGVMAREVPSMPLRDVRAIMRHATTLHRLAEAQCNGDWPCDNGERRVVPCVRCEGGYHPSVLNKAKVCPDCRTCDRVQALCAPHNVQPCFQGDPRGCVLKLKVPSGFGNDWGGEGLVCVP